MDVDKAGAYGQAGDVDALAGLGCPEPADRRDPAVLDRYVGQHVDVAGAVKDPAAAQDQIEHRAASPIQGGW